MLCKALFGSLFAVMYCLFIVPLLIGMWALEKIDCID
jgi:hypothetical protein